MATAAPATAAAAAATSQLAAPPSHNPHAAAAVSKQVAFQRLEGLPHKSATPSAPPANAVAAAAAEPSAPVLQQIGTARMNLNPAAAAALLSAAARGPTDFYASLKASLLPSSSRTSSAAAAHTSSAHASSAAAAAEHDSADEDEWETGGTPAPKAGAASDSADSAAAARADEAVVRSKHEPLFIRKKPFPRPDLGDESKNPSASASAAAAHLAAPSADLDFDDDFAGMSLGGDTMVTASSATPGDGDEEGEEVAVFDLNSADWWFVVPHPDREKEELKAAPAPPVDPQEDEDGFVVVRNKDSYAALSDFLAQMMVRHPEVARLSPEQLRTMLEGSLSGLKEPSTFGRIWQAGRTCYTVWGWSSTAWSLYQDQTVLRLAFAGVIKIGTLCVFLL